MWYISNKNGAYEWKEETNVQNEIKLAHIFFQCFESPYKNPYYWKKKHLYTSWNGYNTIIDRSLENGNTDKQSS